MSHIIPDLNPEFSTQELYAAWQQAARRMEQMLRGTPVKGAQMLAQALVGGFAETANDVEAAWIDYQEGQITEAEVRIHICAGLQATSV